MWAACSSTREEHARADVTTHIGHQLQRMILQVAKGFATALVACAIRVLDIRDAYWLDFNYCATIGVAISETKTHIMLLRLQGSNATYQHGLFKTVILGRHNLHRALHHS